MVNKNDYFSPDFFARLASIKTANWWFDARNPPLLWVLPEYLAVLIASWRLVAGQVSYLKLFKKHVPMLRFLVLSISSKGSVCTEACYVSSIHIA